MQNLRTDVVGCIGKCTSNLTNTELDHITDTIDRTLSHPEGIKLFAKFLEKYEQSLHIRCLELYEICCKYIDFGKSYPESRREIKACVEKVKDMAEDLDIPQINLDLMKSYNDALTSDSTDALLSVLETTRCKCRDFFSGEIHNNFKMAVSQPCSLTN